MLTRRFLYMPSLKPSMMIAIVDPMSRVMNSRGLAPPHMGQLEGVEVHHHVHDHHRVAIMAPNRRYDMPPFFPSWSPPGLAVSRVSVVSSCLGIEALHHSREAAIPNGGIGQTSARHGLY